MTTTYLNNKERFFQTMPNGKIKLKRVSAKLDLQFPRDCRKVYKDAYNTKCDAASALTKYVMQEQDMQLPEAWARVKEMFNGTN